MRSENHPVVTHASATDSAVNDWAVQKTLGWMQVVFELLGMLITLAALVLVVIGIEDKKPLFMLLCALGGICFLAGSGIRLETARWVDHINRAYASLFTAFVAHTNRVGYEDGLHFWGGAAVYDPDGRVILQAPYDEETLTLTELDLNQLHPTRARLPMLRDERTALVLREMQRILSNDNRQSGR